MKRVTVILNIVIVSILLLANCEKDTNGIPVKYYENVTGEGYIYYKYDDGTITPYTFFEGQPWLLGTPKVEVRADDADNYYHIDYIGISNNGKYTCRFLEKKRPNLWAWGEWKIMKFYTISTSGYEVNITAETVQEAAKKATKKNPQVVPIDTIWVLGWKP